MAYCSYLRFCFLVIITGLIFSCKTTLPTQEDTNMSDANVVYAVNGSGIYLYSYQINKSKKIADLAETFLPSTIQVLNDSLIIIAVESEKSNEDVFRANYLGVNLITGQSYLYKEVEYIKQEDVVTTKTKVYSESGNIIRSHDDVLKCAQKNVRLSKLKCCGMESYLFNRELRGDKVEVYSDNGSLFIAMKDSSYLVEEYKGMSKRLGRGGYINPFLSEDKKTIVTEYKNAGIGVKVGRDICLIDVESQEKINLIEDDSYFKPQLSRDKNYLLLGKNRVRNEAGEFVESVFLFDIHTRYAIEIASSNNYIWR